MMRSTLHLFCWLSMAAMLVTCRPDKIEPDPLTDGKPRILSIRFPGIPEKNVTIDQKSFLITIKVPPVLLDDMEPNVEVTENAKLLRALFYPIFTGSCPDCKEICLGLKGAAYDYTTTKYTVKLIPEGPLEIGVMKESIQNAIHEPPTSAYIPCVNLYGNKLPQTVELVHRGTKEKIVLDSTRVGTGWQLSVNKLSMNLWGVKVEPGTYDIDLKLTDGRTLRAPQPVIIQKGPAYITSYQNLIFYGLDATIGTTLSVEGYNLFADDIALELIDREGEKFSLPNLVFERFGQKLGIPIPVSLPAGQYVMRLYQFGKAREICFRLNVRKGKAPDACIGTIGYDPYPCSLQEPVKIGRNLATDITFSLALGLPNRPRMKLKPADGTPAVYYGTIIPYVLQPMPIGPASMTIANDVPIGRYIATLQYLDTEGKVVAESEPYGRVLEVY